MKKTEKIILTNIKWDADGALGLPSGEVIDNPPTDIVKEVMDEGYCDSVADFLSDKHGYCVLGFDAKVLVGYDMRKVATV